MNQTISILLGLLFVINFLVIAQVFLGRLVFYNPKLIFCLTVITQIIPQIFFILNTTVYDKRMLPKYLLVIILSQLAFNSGVNRNPSFKHKWAKYDFDPKMIKTLIWVLCFIGLVPLAFYSKISTVYGGINVVLGHLRELGILGYIIFLLLLFKSEGNRLSRLVQFILLSFPILYFAFIVKGSREITFAYFLISFTVISHKYIKMNKIFSMIFVIVFLTGAFLGSSIREIRVAVKSDENKFEKILKIDYLNNFYGLTEVREIKNGMDSGNALRLIKYVDTNQVYDFGSSIWNDFVYFFVPNALLGSKFKESLYLDVFDNIRTRKYELSLSNGITTITGFGSSYRAFSYFGCILFYFFGRCLSWLSIYRNKTIFGFTVFLTMLIVIPNTVTHTTQYFLARIEFLAIFFLPFFLIFVKKNKLVIIKK